MADTARTLSDLLTNLFQDGQAAGAITENDVRDLIVSLVNPYGCMYVSSAAATTIAVAGTFVKAAGTTTLALGSDFDMPADNRIRYTGVPTRRFIVQAGISMTTAGTNVVLGMKFAKNGVVDDITEMQRKVGTGSDIGAATPLGMFSLATNDYLEMWVTNETNTSAVTLDLMNITIIGMID